MNIEYNNLLTLSKYVMTHTSLIQKSIYCIEIIYELNSKKYIYPCYDNTLQFEKSIIRKKTYFNNQKYFLYKDEIDLSDIILNNIPQNILYYNIKIYTHDTSSKTNIYNVTPEFQVDNINNENAQSDLMYE